MKKADYGVDAPKIIKICITAAILLLSFASCIYSFLSKFLSVWLYWILIISLIFGALGTLYSAIAIILGSRIFKFRERDWLLSLLNITGNERILDVGCGRGLLLIGVAKRLTTGKAIGIDIWSVEDQSGNSPQTTIANAQAEEVKDKIEIITADARKMPFALNEFDFVLSSWALHNIPDQIERKKALREIMRVLKPGGTIVIMDIETYDEYHEFFLSHDFVQVQMLGPRYTFGNPTYIVKATKPKKIEAN